MKDYNRNLRIGIFVVTGLVLLLAILYVLGLSELFTRKAYLSTTFVESVQGLSVGSSVKYRGVPLGTVKSISILISERLVKVDMEIELKHLIAKSSRDQQLVAQEVFTREIKHGLRCRLEYAGITGMKFVNFDYFAKPDDELQPSPFPMSQDDYIYIPSVPSTMEDITTALISAIERLSKIRFEEIAEEVESALLEFNAFLSSPTMKATVNRIHDAAVNIESGSNIIAQMLADDKLNKILDGAIADLEMLKTLTTQLQHDATAMRLPESASDIRAAAAAITNGRQELSNTLFKLNQTLEALTMLCDYLSTDPNSLIRGKSKPRLEE